jgi:hypothetical protein
MGKSQLVWQFTMLSTSNEHNENKILCARYFFPLSPSLELAPTLKHRADLSVSWSFTDGRTPWMGDQLVARPLSKHRKRQTQKNAHTHQTSMPWMGSEPTIPASERAKTEHALDCSATVTGKQEKIFYIKFVNYFIYVLEAFQHLPLF